MASPGRVMRCLGSAVIGLAALSAGSGAFARDLGFQPARPRPVTIRRVARARRVLPPVEVAAPLDIPLSPIGVYFRTPFQVVASPYGSRLVRIPPYQGPDGTYDTPADLTRAINGVPCGEECTARAIARWGYVPAE